MKKDLIRKKISTLAIIFMSSIFFQTTCYKALVIVPVAELVGQFMASKQNNSSKQYDQPVCGGEKRSDLTCKRVHQLIFNEIVEVLDEEGDQVKIKVPNAFYINTETGQQETVYWTRKKNVMRLKQLKNNIDGATLPQPILFTKSMPTHNVATLVMPFKDPATGIAYSAGTRFVYKAVTDASVVVYIFNPNTLSNIEVEIPRTICVTHLPETNQEKIERYVHLIKRWANLENGFIPYVRGGCSFIHTSHGSFSEKTVTIGKNQCSYITLDDFNYSPKDGLDCSGLIVRAAQIYGIPYYYKNTTTLMHYLDQLQAHQEIENGDLIWIPGHVMIVSDVEKNLLIEARGYSHGYGKVHEIALHKVFKGVKNFEQLKTWCFEKRQLKRLTKHGHVGDTFDTFKILKFSSVFDKTY